jgi:hypothetical protein
MNMLASSHASRHGCTQLPAGAWDVKGTERVVLARVGSGRRRVRIVRRIVSVHRECTWRKIARREIAQIIIPFS